MRDRGLSRRQIKQINARYLFDAGLSYQGREEGDYEADDWLEDFEDMRKDRKSKKYDPEEWYNAGRAYYQDNY